MLSPNRALLLTLTRKESLRTGSAHHNHVLLAGHELSDDRGARDLAGDQQPAGGLCAAQLFAGIQGEHMGVGIRR